MSEDSSERTQHCECGSELYHVKWELEEDGDRWAECAECGRPTGTLGDGMEKQREWEARNRD